MMIRQGDVLLVPITAPHSVRGLSPVLPENDRVVLAHGEVTGPITTPSRWPTASACSARTAAEAG